MTSEIRISLLITALLLFMGCKSTAQKNNEDLISVEYSSFLGRGGASKIIATKDSLIGEAMGAKSNETTVFRRKINPKDWQKIKTLIDYSAIEDRLIDVNTPKTYDAPEEGFTIVTAKKTNSIIDAASHPQYKELEKLKNYLITLAYQ